MKDDPAWFTQCLCKSCTVTHLPYSIQVWFEGNSRFGLFAIQLSPFAVNFVGATCLSDVFFPAYQRLVARKLALVHRFQPVDSRFRTILVGVVGYRDFPKVVTTTCPKKSRRLILPQIFVENSFGCQKGWLLTSWDLTFWIENLGTFTSLGHLKRRCKGISCN